MSKTAQDITNEVRRIIGKGAMVALHDAKAGVVEQTQIDAFVGDIAEDLGWKPTVDDAPERA